MEKQAKDDMFGQIKHLRSLRMVTHCRKPESLPFDTGYLAQVTKDNSAAHMK